MRAVAKDRPAQRRDQINNVVYLADRERGVESAVNVQGTTSQPSLDHREARADETEGGT